MQDDLTQPLRVVSMLDPAIDWTDAERMGQYARTRDPSLVTAKPGAVPVWTVVAPLAVADMMAVETLTGTARFVQAFRLAVVQIENSPTAGLSRKPTLQVRLASVDRVVWSDADLDDVARTYGVRFLYEIGSVIYERALQGNCWGGGVLYTLPPSSLDGLTENRPPRAEQNPAVAGTALSAP